MSNTMTYQGYTTSMTFDADDKIIVGRVLDVDDIISFNRWPSSRPCSTPLWTATSPLAKNSAALPKSRPAAR